MAAFNNNIDHLLRFFPTAQKKRGDEDDLGQAQPQPLDTAEVYDPQTDGWQPLEIRPRYSASPSPHPLLQPQLLEPVVPRLLRAVADQPTRRESTRTKVQTKFLVGEPPDQWRPTASRNVRDSLRGRPSSEDDARGGQGGWVEDDPMDEAEAREEQARSLEEKEERAVSRFLEGRAVAACGSASSSDAPPRAPPGAPVPAARGSTSSAADLAAPVRAPSLTSRKSAVMDAAAEHLGLGTSETLHALQVVMAEVGETYRCDWRTSEMEAKHPAAAAEVVRRLVAAGQIPIAVLYSMALQHEPRTHVAAQRASTALGGAPSILSASTPPKPVVAPHDLALAKANWIVEDNVLAKDLDAYEWNVLSNAVLHLGDRSSRLLRAFLVPESVVGDESVEQLNFQNWQLVVPSEKGMLPELQDKLERNVLLSGAFDYEYNNYLLVYGNGFEMLKWGTTTVGLERLGTHASKLDRLEKRLPLLLMWLPGEIGTSGTSSELRMKKFLSDNRNEARAARLRLLGFEEPVGSLQGGDLGESGENLRLDPSVDLLELCQFFQTQMAWSRRARAAAATDGFVGRCPLADALRLMEKLTDDY